MIKQCTAPGSFEVFAVLASDIESVSKLFPISLYQVRDLILTQEEEEALTDYGADVAAGVITEEEATVAVAKQRISLWVEVSPGGKATFKRFH